MAWNCEKLHLFWLLLKEAPQSREKIIDSKKMSICFSKNEQKNKLTFSLARSLARSFSPFLEMMKTHCEWK